MYDQFGPDGPQGFGGAGGPFGGQGGYYSSGFDFSGFSGFDGFDDLGDLGSIFSNIFGGGSRRGRRNGPIRGADINARMEITFEQAFLGTEKEIVVNRNEKCEVCNGTGAELVRCNKFKTQYWAKYKQQEYVVIVMAQVKL